MRYTVVWEPAAQAALATIWISSANRGAVTAAEARIHQLLRADPRGNGSLRSEGLYVIDVLPLRALFEVSDPDRLVKVVAVHALSVP